MKKNNLATLLGIAFVVAIAATGIFYGLFVNKLSSNSGTGLAMIVAAKPLKAGAVLTSADLKQIPWPAGTLPKGTYSDASKVVGKTLFDSVNEDEPLLENRLASADGEGSGIPAGMRAVSVHVSDSTGVLGMLRAGHHVDVQVVRKANETVTEVRTVLQNLKVLSVNPISEQSSQGHNLPVVTLLAKPGEADALAAADAGARVRLALRNPLDEEVKGRTALSLEGVMHSAAPIQP